MQYLDEFEYASFSKRLLAAFLDALVLVLPCALASHIIPVLGSLIVLFLYAPALESSKAQATLGKYWIGIKVTDPMGKRITLRAALIRTLIKLLSSMLLFIGHFLMFFTQKKQALHDLVAETIVIKGYNESISIVDEWINSLKGMFRSRPCSTQSSDFYYEMEKLQSLREREILTESEFQEQKKKIFKKYDK